MDCASGLWILLPVVTRLLKAAGKSFWKWITAENSFCMSSHDSNLIILSSMFSLRKSYFACWQHSMPTQTNKLWIFRKLSAKRRCLEIVYIYLWSQFSQCFATIFLIWFFPLPILGLCDKLTQKCSCGLIRSERSLLRVASCLSLN